MTKRQELQRSRKVDHATGSQTKTWIDRELAGSGFRDVRLNKRFRKLFEQLSDLVQLACPGGYLARAGDSPPGNKVIWKGLSRLTDIEMGFVIAAKLVGN